MKAMFKSILFSLFLLPLMATQLNPSRQFAESPIPLLAYYYIWFDHSSWDRAKVDYPLLGRYSSDDRSVMEQHIHWAKDVGIDGFIVSWKSTEKLNMRLEQLIELAELMGFKLVIIYQGLDFERDPLLPERVRADLVYFADQYSQSEVFDLFGKPVVIWSGTWKYSEGEVASVTRDLGDRLFILATERNLEGYRRLAPYVDGDAYYWSSVNPDTYPDYQGKLDEMSEAIQAEGGLWIAPAAPGFDARLIGGTRVVERKDGGTLLQQLETALQSSPDAIGLISWNEFSENTHIEPSQNFGARYLEVLADFSSTPLPAFDSFASDEPINFPESSSQSISGPATGSLTAVILVLALGLLSLIVIAARKNTRI